MVDPEILSTVRTYLEKVRSHGIPVELGACSARGAGARHRR